MASSFLPSGPTPEMGVYVVGSVPFSGWFRRPFCLAHVQVVNGGGTSNRKRGLLIHLLLVSTRGKIESQVLPIPAAETLFLQPRSTWEVLVEDPGCLLGSPALDSLWIATRALWLRRQRPIWETQGPVGRVQWDLCLGLALEIRMFCTSHH